MMAAIATGALALTVVSVLALPYFPFFTPFIFAFFLLALAAVISGLKNRKVTQRDPDLDPKGWRN